MMEYRKRIYDKYAAAFQDAEGLFNGKEAIRWGRAYDYYFRKWLPDDRAATIVDLACGGGKLLYFFKQRNYKNLKGVDISPEQVKLAQQVCHEVLEVNALDYLAAHPGSFDLITGLDIVEHFSKDEVFHFLDGCFAALKPGGRLILQTPNAESPWGTTHRYNDLTHEVCFNPNALSRLMQVCGFSRIETRQTGPIPWNYSLKSSFRYLAWQVIRGGLMIWNVVETGNKGSGVFTRIFLISGCKI